MTDFSLACMTDQLKRLIEQDSLRLKALTSVHHLNLPEGYIAAGFVRNLVWDFLHNKCDPTPLNDVDVIYYDDQEADKGQHLYYESRLNNLMPEVKWQVRNQAMMHLRNDDRPYVNVIDAMGFWPEKETAVAVRLLDHGRLECVSAFGFESLFDLKLTHNPRRSKALFDVRIKSKAWFVHWPLLQVVNSK